MAFPHAVTQQSVSFFFPLLPAEGDLRTDNIRSRYPGARAKIPVPPNTYHLFLPFPPNFISLRSLALLSGEVYDPSPRKFIFSSHVEEGAFVEMSDFSRNLSSNPTSTSLGLRRRFPPFGRAFPQDLQGSVASFLHTKYWPFVPLLNYNVHGLFPEGAGSSRSRKSSYSLLLGLLQQDHREPGLCPVIGSVPSCRRN